MDAVPVSSERKRSLHAGLFVLRLGAGFSLLLIFWMPKVHDAWGYLHTGHWPFVDFNRKIGLPFPRAVAVFQTLNESAGALLVAVGLVTRYAAASLTIGFIAATFCSLEVGESIWLTAAYFALMFGVLILTGPGDFSIDHLLQVSKAHAKTHRADGRN